MECVCFCRNFYEYCVGKNQFRKFNFNCGWFDLLNMCLFKIIVEVVAHKKKEKKIFFCLFLPFKNIFENFLFFFTSN